MWVADNHKTPLERRAQFAYAGLMLKRLWPALACAFGLVALVHCGGGGGGDDDDTILGDVSHLEAGAPTCASTRSCSSGTSSSGGKSASSSGHAGSSGASGNTSSGGGTTSSSGDPGETFTRVAPVTNLPTSSAGCGNGNVPTRGADNYDFADFSRYYIPFQPTNYSPNGTPNGTGYPLLVALHGCYGDPELFANGFGSFQDAVGSEGVIVYGAAQNAQSSCGWDVGGQSDVDYLDQVIADVSSKFCIDQSRVYLLGFSWGGYMAQYYSCNRPGTIRAFVGGASGYPDWQKFPNMDVRQCGQIPSLVYGRTHDDDEQIANSYHSRDQRVAINQCNPAGFDAAAPLVAGSFSQVAGCIDYGGCVNGLRTTFCEDPKDLTDPDIGGDPSWNHTIWQPYHPAIWSWLKDVSK